MGHFIVIQIWKFRLTGGPTKVARNGPKWHQLLLSLPLVGFYTSGAKQNETKASFVQIYWFLHVKTKSQGRRSSNTHIKLAFQLYKHYISGLTSTKLQISFVESSFSSECVRSTSTITSVNLTQIKFYTNYFSSQGNFDGTNITT